MEPALLVGPTSRALGAALAARLGVQPLPAQVARFPDGEANVQVPASVAGREALVLQALFPEPDRRLMELLLLADALHREGARRCTAVIPYLAYARQDHRAGRGEPLGAQVACRALSGADLARAVVVELHARGVETALAMPLTHLSAAPLLAEALRPRLPDDAVVVAPDLGAAKLAQRYAELLQRPMAVIAKVRVSGERVRSSQVLGEVAGRAPILVDDMISTGATIAAAAAALREARSQPLAAIAATHGLFVGDAPAVLDALPHGALLTTDSVDHATLPMRTEVVSLAVMLAVELEQLLAH